MENTYALGHVTSIPKEQNLPMLFNEGENSQVTGSYLKLMEVWMRLNSKSKCLLLLHCMIKHLVVFCLWIISIMQLWFSLVNIGIKE